MAKKKIGYGDLFCTRCGERIEKGAQVCPKCGAPYGAAPGGTPYGAGGVGWSEKADDPCFKRFSKKSKRTSVIWMVLVSAIICAVIRFTGGLEGDELIKVCGGVMAIIWTFWLIWLLVQFSKSKSWEGAVERKTQTRREVRKNDNDGGHYTQTQTVYQVLFRTENGKRKKLTEIDRTVWYDYLREGDRVRYHGKYMHYYEKYDKSQDAVIPCAACGSARDARETFCGRCGCVLLKGRPAAQPGYAPPSFPPQAAQPTAPAPAAQPAKRFCPSCGAPTQGAPFCSECGAKLG